MYKILLIQRFAKVSNFLVFTLIYVPLYSILNQKTI
jgi:hypothetical protein